MLKKDSVIFGVIVSIASIVLTAALLAGVLFAFDLPFNNNAKLFLFSFVPAILLLRWYSKLQFSKTVKGLLTVLFFGFCIMLYSLYAMGYFSNDWIRK